MSNLLYVLFLASVVAYIVLLFKRDKKKRRI